MFSILSVLVIVQVIFSLWPVFIKSVINQGINTLYIAILRDAIASLILWITVWIEDGFPNLFNQNLYTRITSVDIGERRLFFGLGLASTINSVGYLIALNYVTSFNSALLHPTVPVFSAILGWFFGVEILTQRKIIGAVLCILGSIAVVLTSFNLTLSSSLIGNLLLVTQSFAMSVLLVGQKFVHKKHSVLKTTAIYYSIGTLISFPILFLILYSQQQLISFQFDQSLVLILVVLFGSIFVIAFNYAALTWANKMTTPAIPASSMMLQPPLTYIFGHFINNDRIRGYSEVIGSVIIVIGLVLTIFPSNSTISQQKRTSKANDDEDDGFASDDNSNNGIKLTERSPMLMKIEELTSNQASMAHGSINTAAYDSGYDHLDYDSELDQEEI